MVRIGINGNLIDAVFKSRVLQCQPEKSVRLILSPHCRPLRSFFEAIKAVQSIEFDEQTRFIEGHGEQNKWTVPIDIDMTYPGYPSEWIINFIGGYAHLPKISRRDWFGSYDYLLDGPGSNLPHWLYCERQIAATHEKVLAEWSKQYPSREIVIGENRDDILQNVRLAAACRCRVVSFGAEMALMGALGLSCIVARGNKNPGHYADLFRSYGEVLAEDAELFEKVIHQLEPPSNLLNPGKNLSSPNLAICIPTICCGDLLEESIPPLLLQLGERDDIFILDNGAQELERRLPQGKIHIIEPKHNLGVAGSWNRFLKEIFFNQRPYGPKYDWILMLNDDIGLGAQQLNEIKSVLKTDTFSDKWLVYGPYYWSVFAINRACVENVGFFDENFYPAYFEDNDYHYRLKLIDPSRFAEAGTAFSPNVKRNSATLARLPKINRFSENQKYYHKKWGGGPGHERYRNPFDQAL
jgi:hypothetical protein